MVNSPDFLTIEMSLTRQRYSLPSKSNDSKFGIWQYFYYFRKKH